MLIFDRCRCIGAVVALVKMNVVQKIIWYFYKTEIFLMERLNEVLFEWFNSQSEYDTKKQQTSAIT